MEFITTDQRIAVENFYIGKIYTITFKDSTFITRACIGKGADYVMFQEQAPKMLFTLNMQTASTIDSIELGGGGSATLIEKSISANGVYNASSDSADGYSKVTVDVPNTYTAGDEGKVVSSGALVAQTAHATITINGSYDTTLNNSVEVDVAGGSATLIEKSINANGVYNASSDSADGYSKVTVDVPNTYTAGDEGKVVSSGALVAQTAHATITINGSYDTTLNNSVEVDVAGGSATLIEKSINANGVYNASSDSADGYSKVTVDVPNTYTAGDEGKVVSSGALVAQTAHATITTNNTYDTTLNNSVTVDVPNTYTAGDEGKVVSNGALVAQTAHATITTNNTYDTTLNNSVTVNVAGAAYSLLTPDSPSSFQYCYAYIINIDNKTIIVAQFKLTSSSSSISLSYDSSFVPNYTAASSTTPSYAGRLSTGSSQVGTLSFDTANNKITMSLNTASSAGQLIVFVRGD